MPRQHLGEARKWQNTLPYAANQGSATSLGEVSPADGARKKGISSEDHILLGDVEAATAWGMAGGKEGFKLKACQAKDLIRL